MSEDLVSVIIPTCNRLELLKKAIDSVFVQSYQRIEIVVVEAGSNDGTKAYLQKLTSDKPGRVVVVSRQEKLNGSQARNVGVEASSGKWLAFLDDDDICLPERIEQQLACARQDAEVVAVSSNYLVRKPGREDKLVKLPINLSQDKMLEDNYLGGASVCFCSREMFDTVGGFDNRLLSSQDHDLWIKFYLEGKIAICQVPTVVYFIGGQPTITRNFNYKYSGRRHFYFKYRHLMSPQVRKLCLLKLVWMSIFCDRCVYKWRAFCKSSVGLCRSGYYKYVLIVLKYLLTRRLANIYAGYKRPLDGS